MAYKKYRKGVKENHQRIVDYLQKTCGLCIDFTPSKKSGIKDLKTFFIPD